MIILAAAVLAAACNPQEMARRAGARTRLSIATGGTGGVYYPYGGALARVITEHLPGVEATAEVTAASVDNLKLVRDHKSDIAFSLADTLDDAVAGRGAFARKGPVPARVLAVLYDNYTHLVASGASGVSRVADLAGKHVSIGAAGSGTELIATRMLRAAGLDPARDLTPVSLGVAQSVDALKDGKIDAFFWSGGVPTASVLDLASTPGTAWRLVPNDDVLGALQQRYGASLYSRLVVPRDTYAGLPADVPVVGVANLLVVHADMPEQLAHDVTRMLFEHQAEIAAVHAEAARLRPATASTASPAPFHPGAVRYYRERGSWAK
ncbi:MAG: TAXI family TRAP transporter solute-binding subunit [Rhodospirillaceae bacterium]